MIAIAQPGGKLGEELVDEARSVCKATERGMWPKQARRAHLAELSSKDGQKRFNMRLRVNNRKRALT